MLVRSLSLLIVAFGLSPDTGLAILSESSDGDKGNDEHVTGYVVLLKASSELGNMTQSVRRSLKTMRKWCHSHPTEMRLGKCLANYFNIEIPGLRRYDPPFSAYVDEDNIIRLQELRSSRYLQEDRIHGKNKREERERKKLDDTKRFFSLIVHKEWTENVALILGNTMQNLTDNFIYYRDAIMNNRLVICMWNYIVTKFWHWVDTAPID